MSIVIEKGRMYGSIFPLSGTISQEILIEKIETELLPDAKRTIGQGTVEIRMKFPQGHDHSQHAIAWYTDDEVMRLPEEGIVDPIYKAKQGYFYCGRIKV